MPKRSKIPTDKVRPLLVSQREKLEAQRKLKLESQVKQFEKRVSRTTELQSRIKNFTIFIVIVY